MDFGDLMCGCRLITYKKRTSLLGMFVVGKVVPVWGPRVYGTPLYPPLNFAVNLTML